jgi:hypothetical protein
VIGSRDNQRYGDSKVTYHNRNPARASSQYRARGEGGKWHRAAWTRPIHVSKKSARNSNGKCAGAKARFFCAFTARLKSCPDTKQSQAQPKATGTSKVHFSERGGPLYRRSLGFPGMGTLQSIALLTWCRMSAPRIQKMTSREMFVAWSAMRSRARAMMIAFRA